MKRKILRKRLTIDGRNYFKNKTGAILILTALMLPPLIMIAGLAIQVSIGYMNQRKLQAIADAVAIGAALEAEKDGLSLQSRATSDAIANGFTPGGSNVLTVRNPPQSGSYTQMAAAVEVILSQQKSLAFSNLFLPSPVTISARAVAMPVPGATCILGRGTTAQGVFSIDTGSSVTALQCSVAVNSNHSGALSLTGNSKLTADAITIVGNYTVASGSSIVAKEGITTGAPEAVNPYESLSVPSYSGCNYNNFTPATSQTINPGVYCGGITLNNAVVITMNPGIYILDRGVFNMNSTSSLQGTGVTIILTSSTGSSYPTMTIQNSSTINISAPTSGSTAGVAIYIDFAVPLSNTVNFRSTGISYINGALYLPRNIFEYSGGGLNTPNSCTQFITRLFHLHAPLKAGFCANPPIRTVIKLVE